MAGFFLSWKDVEPRDRGCWGVRQSNDTMR